MLQLVLCYEKIIALKNAVTEGRNRKDISMQNKKAQLIGFFHFLNYYYFHYDLFMIFRHISLRRLLIPTENFPSSWHGE